MTNIDVGRKGEQIATDFLKKKGFKIVCRNFRSRFAEIDIIVEKENKLCFVEVKTRVGTDKGKPYEAIDKRKVFHLKMATEYYLLQNPHKNYKLSIDVVSIILDNGLNVQKLDYFEAINTFKF